MDANNLGLPLSDDGYLKSIGLKKPRKLLIPLNIQLFADSGDGEGDGENKDPQPKTYSEEEMNKIIAERDKFKQANDALSKENATYKRKAKEKLSDDEKKEQERAEKDQALQEAQRELTTIKMSKELLLGGFEESEVNNILESFNKGDSVEFAKTLATSVKELVEKVRKEEKESFQKGSTLPPAGNSKDGKNNGVNPIVEKYINNKKNNSNNSAREMIFGKK